MATGPKTQQTFINSGVIPELLCRVEALGLGDGEHAEEALPRAEVVVPDRGVVLLSRRVEDVDLYLLAVQHYLQPGYNKH